MGTTANNNNIFISLLEFFLSDSGCKLFYLVSANESQKVSDENQEYLLILEEWKQRHLLAIHIQHLAFFYLIWDRDILYRMLT